MKRFIYLCRLIPLALGVTVVAYFWPAPRLTLAHDRICWHLAFSRDSTMLAMLDRDAGLNMPGAVLVWHAATGKLMHRLDYDARDYPSKVVFAPDGKTLGIVDAGRITKWDFTTGRINEYTHPDWSHDPEQYYGREILFAPDGRWLAHNLSEGRVYDVETGACVHDYHERWPDRSGLACGGCVAAFVNGRVTTLDAVTGAEIGIFPMAPRGPMARTTFMSSAAGTRGIYFGDRNRWVIHNAVTGEECAWGRDTDEPVNFGFYLSPDHRFLAVSAFEPITGALSALHAQLAGGEGWLHVYDTATGAEVCVPIAHGYPACFAPDGKTLAVADCQSQRVGLWDWPPGSRWPQVLLIALPTAVVCYGLMRCPFRLSLRRRLEDMKRMAGSPCRNRLDLGEPAIETLNQARSRSFSCSGWRRSLLSLNRRSFRLAVAVDSRPPRRRKKSQKAPRKRLKWPW